MKVSLLTVVLNCSDYIEACMRSVVDQDYKNIEHIIVDGGSTDGTISIIQKYSNEIAHFISEKDTGMYDALNKGLEVATGDVVGVLNADDVFAGNDVISAIVDCFKKTNCDVTYGNLDFICRLDPNKITRKWRSKSWNPGRVRRGWMPAHPTLYLKRNLIVNKGYYSLNFGACADYDLMLRILYQTDSKVVFLDKLMVLMRNGGMSNGSLKKVYHTMINDYKVLVSNQMPSPLLVLFLKKVRKLSQFLSI